MSHAGHFHSRYVQRNKETNREIKTYEDFPSRRLRLPDGSEAEFKGGKQVPGTHVTVSKNVAKVDVPQPESKFYKETPISTILETKQAGEKETAGETETVARVRKPLDVNARKFKL